MSLTYLTRLLELGRIKEEINKVTKSHGYIVRLNYKEQFYLNLHECDSDQNPIGAEEALSSKEIPDEVKEVVIHNLEKFVP
nr:hypothetical protein 68 [bacterium]